MAVFLVGTGYFFLYNMFLSGDATMAETFQNMGMLLLTSSRSSRCGCSPREYSAGTMELLLTLPLQPWQIVLGKYLGAVTMLVLIAAGTAIDLVPLYLFGNPETMTILPVYRLPAAGHGLPRRRPALLGIDAEPDRRRAHHRAGAAGASGSSDTCRLPDIAGAARAWSRYLSFALHFADFVQGLVRTEAMAYYLIVSRRSP